MIETTCYNVSHTQRPIVIQCRLVEIFISMYTTRSMDNSIISFTDEFTVLLLYNRVAAFLENIWCVHSGGLCIIENF
jgi:hypothetical protein